MHDTKLIIFDWDDVFTHGSTAGYFACYRAALKAVDVILPIGEEQARIESKWGSGHIPTIEELLRENPEKIKEAVQAYEDSFFGSTFVNELSVMSGTGELLKRLGRKYTLALATGMHPKLLKEVVIPKFNIPDLFETIVTVYDLDDPAHSKPHPKSAKIILERTGFVSSEAVMIGDASSDVGMAQAAGIRPIVVLSGHLNRKQAEGFGVKDIVETVLDVESVL